MSVNLESSYSAVRFILKMLTTIAPLLLVILFTVVQGQVEFPDVSLKVLTSSTFYHRGSVVNLYCTANGTTSGITWKHKNMNITSDRRYVIIPMDNSPSILTVAFFNFFFVGDYACSASNDAGIVSSSAILLQEIVLDFVPLGKDRTSPHIVSIIAGQPAAINCDTIISRPEEIVSWDISIGTAILSIDLSVDKAFASINNSLLLLEPVTSDSGKVFRCGPENLFIGIVGFGYLQIDVQESSISAQPLHLLVHPQDVVALRGSTVLFECIPGGIGSSSTISSWTWADSSRTIRAVANGFRIILADVGDADVGIYTCEVPGLGNYTATLSIADIPILTTSLPSPMSLTYGEDLSLSCATSSPHTVNWEWYFNGFRLINEINSSLLLPNVMLNQSGTYQCIAYSLAGSNQSVASVQVNAIAANINVPLPHTRVAFIGWSFSITCFAKGVPPPQYSWLKAAIPIESGGSFDLTNERELRIMNVDSSHAGNYSCKVQNMLPNGEPVGVDVDYTQLRVIEPTTITAGNRAVYTAQVGTRGVFLCTVTHSAEAAVAFQWTKDGQLIDTNSRMRLESLQYRGIQVVIDQVVYGDAGNYQCIVMTSVNGILAPEVRTTPTMFVVTDTPVVPVIHLLNHTSSNSIEVQWSFTGDITIIINYTFEVQLASKPNSSWTSVMQWSDNVVTKAEVSNPIFMAYTLFNTRMVVTHVDGGRVFSVIEQVRTGVGIPDDPPRDVEVKTPNSRSLQLSWMAPANPRGPIINYMIRYRKVGNSIFTDVFVGNPNTTYSLNGLPEFERWEVQVAAMTKAGLGPFSDIIAANFIMSNSMPFVQSAGFIILMVVIGITLVITLAMSIYTCKRLVTSKNQAMKYNVGDTNSISNDEAEACTETHVPHIRFAAMPRHTTAQTWKSVVREAVKKLWIQ